MNIKITTDSTADLPVELYKKYDIDVLSLPIILGEHIYKDEDEETIESIYDNVENHNIFPTTCAANISDYIDLFGKWLAQGYDSVIHFNIGSVFSSSYQNACIAAEQFDNVYVVDTKNLSTGQGIIALRAAESVQLGKSVKEITKECIFLISRVKTSFVIDTLDYLYKGGRCSAVAFLGGNILKIKPSIEVEAGKMAIAKKYHGKFDKIILEYIKDRLKGSENIDQKRIYITHTRCREEVVRAVIEEIRRLCPDCKEIIETTAGATITSHCGPNTIGIAYIKK